MSYSNLINDVISYNLQRSLREQLKKIFPLKICEIRHISLITEKKVGIKEEKEKADEKKVDQKEDKKETEKEQKEKPKEERKEVKEAVKKEESVEEKAKEVPENAKTDN